MASSRPEGSVNVESETAEGGDISNESSKLPEAARWMGGRAVFFRPEGRASNAARRDIVHTNEEGNQLGRAVVDTVLALQARTPEQVEAEIADFRAFEQEQARQQQQ
jgi:hypothetical protein